MEMSSSRYNTSALLTNDMDSCVAAATRRSHPSSTKIMQDDGSTLCETCLGITEENVLPDDGLDDEDGETRIYPHHRHILALKQSADKGCILCLMIFNELRAQSELTDNDLLDAMIAFEAFDQGHLEREQTPRWDRGWRETLYSSRVPGIWKIPTSDEESGFEMVFNASSFIPNNEVGRLFISHRTSRTLEKKRLKLINVVMAGRPSRSILQLHVECILEVYTSHGTSFALKNSLYYMLTKDTQMIHWQTGFHIDQSHNTVYPQRFWKLSMTGHKPV
jgi:hypothetical protein